jgi:hypothetical protein
MAMKQSTNLVALNHERDRAIALLTEGFAQGELDEDELEDRLERVEQATEVEEIRTAIAELDGGSASDSDEMQAIVPAPITLLADAEEVPDSHRVVAILAENARRGLWTPALTETVISVMGNAVLDFREARLAPGVTTVKIRAVMADVTIIVPPGLPVENACLPILGTIELDRGVRGSDDCTPRLRLTGVVVMASATVQQKSLKRDAEPTADDRAQQDDPPRLGSGATTP